MNTSYSVFSAESKSVPLILLLIVVFEPHPLLSDYQISLLIKMIFKVSYNKLYIAGKVIK